MAADYTPVDFNALKHWARMRCRIVRNTVTGSTSIVQVLPRSAMRWGLIIPQESATTISFWLQETAPTTNGNQFSTTAIPYMWTEDDFGDAIQYPVWLKFGAAGGTFDFLSFEYDPERKAVLDAYIARCVSVARSL